MDEENRGKWKLFFDLELKTFGGKTALAGNLNAKDTKNIFQSKDSFISEVLTIWAEVNFEDFFYNHFALGSSNARRPTKEDQKGSISSTTTEELTPSAKNSRECSNYNRCHGPRTEDQCCK